MNGYLLDTNVISEVIRSTPHTRVVTFLTKHDDLWLSSIVIHELEYGLERMAQGQRRSGLQDSLLGVIAEYEDRILPLERVGAEWAARFRAQAHRFGRTLDLGDALIAGTAKTHDLAIVTRNVRDFDVLEVQVVNPWQTR
ncbi:MAG: type II toxin-antitoxin system VapC family toxin [Nitrospira sp.]|nr:type II toxin-antitoxin system VapC family toxin [Nitrospira sp.]MDE0404216.1 type II toxin-antitoxin system VapC family toxin [Nitrospira sp.]MDE0486986.1 type II toxin-antitoxin system VapC family toxin [Nitrospira sp.]